MEESWLEVADCLLVPSLFSTTRTRHPAPLTVLANGSRFLYLLDLRDRKLLVRYKANLEMPGDKGYKRNAISYNIVV